MWSLADVAALRVELGAHHRVSCADILVSECVYSHPDQGNLLLPYHPIFLAHSLPSPLKKRVSKKASSALLNAFTLDEESLTKYGIAQCDLEELVSHARLLPKEGTLYGVESLGEIELTRQLIGGGNAKKAEAYGQLLKEEGIEFLPLLFGYRGSKYNNPSAHVLSFNSLKLRDYLQGKEMRTVGSALDAQYLNGGSEIIEIKRYEIIPLAQPLSTAQSPMQCCA